MDRAITWSPPALEWYRQNCCPACGKVNGTGQLCDRTHRCLLCGAIVCYNASGRCPICGGFLDGYWRRRATCGYKGCAEPAVREWPRIGVICKKHLVEKGHFTCNHEYEEVEPTYMFLHRYRCRKCGHETVVDSSG